jgi:hypothetical protein
MLEDEMNKIREELYLLILQEADYNKVLKVSQKLDKLIAEFTNEMLSPSREEK